MENGENPGECRGGMGVGQVGFHHGILGSGPGPIGIGPPTKPLESFIAFSSSVKPGKPLVFQPVL